MRLFEEYILIAINTIKKEESLSPLWGVIFFLFAFLVCLFLFFRGCDFKKGLFTPGRIFIPASIFKKKIDPKISLSIKNNKLLFISEFLKWVIGGGTATIWFSFMCFLYWIEADSVYIHSGKKFILYFALIYGIAWLSISFLLMVTAFIYDIDIKKLAYITSHFKRRQCKSKKEFWIKIALFAFISLTAFLLSIFVLFSIFRVIIMAISSGYS